MMTILQFIRDLFRNLNFSQKINSIFTVFILSALSVMAVAIYSRDTLHLYVMVGLVVIEWLVAWWLTKLVIKPVFEMLNLTKTINKTGEIPEHFISANAEVSELMSCIKSQYDEKNLLLERLNRTNRILLALAAITENINSARNENDIFTLLCQQLTQHTKLTMVWVGKEDANTHQVIPVAASGLGLTYLESIAVSTRIDIVEGNGPTGTALRDNQVMIVNDYQKSNITTPWKALIKEYGWEAAAAFPILSANQPIAVLTVYHPIKDSFSTETIQLISVICGLVGSRVQNLQRNT